MLTQLDYRGDSVIGRTIAAAILDDDIVRLVFADGTFVNAELRIGHDYWDTSCMENRPVVVKSNLDGGSTNPYEAGRLLRDGIITQAEHDAFCAEYAQHSAREDKKREQRDRAEFERLKKKFA